LKRRDRLLFLNLLAGKGPDVFGAPPDIPTRVFARLPDALRMRDRENNWSRARGGGALHSFLEGPSFDRAGNLYCVDICHGRIFRISPLGEWEVFAHYDGHPNGLKIHRDGRIFVADQKCGLLSFDPATGERTTLLEGTVQGPFGGLNDLVFADNGDLYFTDPGESALENPVGRVFRLRTSGELDLLIDGLPYPNGLVLNAKQDVLYLAVTRSLQVLRVPLRSDYRGVFKCGVFVQLSGGLAGPDGMALDEAGNLIVAHSGFATAWMFSPLGEPLGRVRSCAGIRTSNVAFGGADRKSLIITESEHGVILEAKMDVSGRAMYSHL
jgi:gluconolactonase